VKAGGKKRQGQHVARQNWVDFNQNPGRPNFKPPRSNFHEGANTAGKVFLKKTGEHGATTAAKELGRKKKKKFKKNNGKGGQGSKKKQKKKKQGWGGGTQKIVPD